MRLNESKQKPSAKRENFRNLPRHILRGYLFIDLTQLIKLKPLSHLYIPSEVPSKRCSASGLNCSYVNPYIKLKLIEMAMKLYQDFEIK